MSTTIDVANAQFGPLVRKPITFVFAEFGTILEAGNPDPKQFTPGPYAAAGKITLMPGGKYTYKAIEMRNGVRKNAEFTESFTEDRRENAVFLNFTWNDQPTQIAYIAFNEGLKEGRGISLIPGMSKTYLLVRD
jgi:hypothetical protein